MRMVGCPDRFTRRVVDRTHLVDEEERVEIGESGNRERPMDDETAPFDETLSGDDTHMSAGIHDASYDPTEGPTGFRDLRVDIVGSFLRPPALKAAFAAYDAGRLDADGLRHAQDSAIRELIAEEERHGLPIVGAGNSWRALPTSRGRSRGAGRWSRRPPRGSRTIRLPNPSSGRSGTRCAARSPSACGCCATSPWRNTATRRASRPSR